MDDEQTDSGSVSGKIEEAKSAQTVVATGTAENAKEIPQSGEELVLDNTPSIGETEKDGFVTRMLKAINAARQEGASKQQLADMRSFLRQQTDWHPTKKRLGKADRRARRNASKKARQINQRRVRSHAITKGHRKSGRV